MREATIQALEKGYRAQQAGNTAKAEKLYRGILKREPGNVHALNLLGMLCVNSSRPAEAIRFISRAIAVDGADPDAHANIALAYKDSGKATEAVRHFRQSIRLNPDNPVVHNNLGNVLRLVDQPGEAARSYERALKLQPSFAECWSNLAAAMNESDRQEKGLRAVDRALQLDPALAQAWNNKGDILLAQAKYGEALEHYRKAAELSPKYAAALINMARVQRDMEAPEEALATLGKALDIEPRNPEAHHVLGVLHEQMGDRASAATHFQVAIDAAPEMGIAHYQLAQINGRTGTDAELAAMRSAWDTPGLSRNHRMYLAFGLARALEERGRYDEAYAHVARGNAIKAETRPYDDAETAEYVDALYERVAAAAARVGRDCGCRDERPVFVVGMPRSGTSLTEQILASHSAIAGAGELSHAYDTAHRVRDITRRKFPDNMDLLSEAQFRELGEYYVSRHSGANLAARYVVDKTPLNFQYIGLLGIALPRARFIYCHRDPGRQLLGHPPHSVRRKADLRPFPDCPGPVLSAAPRPAGWLEGAVSGPNPGCSLRRHGGGCRTPEPAPTRIPRPAVRARGAGIPPDPPAREDAERQPGTGTDIRRCGVGLEAFRKAPGAPQGGSGIKRRT